MVILQFPVSADLIAVMWIGNCEVHPAPYPAISQHNKLGLYKINQILPRANQIHTCTRTNVGTKMTGVTFLQEKCHEQWGVGFPCCNGICTHATLHLAATFRRITLYNKRYPMSSKSPSGRPRDTFCTTHLVCRRGVNMAENRLRRHP